MVSLPRAMVCSALFAIGCGSSSAKPNTSGSGGDDDAAGSDQGTGMSYSGAHGLGYYKLAANPAGSLSTPVMTTQASGSTIVVSVGRGSSKLFAIPTDNKGNSPYVMQDQIHPYTQFPTSGTALYTFKPAKGGAGFQVTTTTGQNDSGQSDEITMAAVEVADSGKIESVQWNEVAEGNPLTTKSVTTDGPATLVAFWWGDGFPRTPQTAKPDSGFMLLDSNAQETDSFVQCAVAVKTVTAAGTYGLTWTATPSQGAQMWLVAVE
jgi:hypothetical protein